MSWPMLSTPTCFPAVSTISRFDQRTNTRLPSRVMFSFSFSACRPVCAAMSLSSASRFLPVSDSPGGTMVPTAGRPRISSARYPKNRSAYSLKKVTRPSMSMRRMIAFAFETSSRYFASLAASSVPRDSRRRLNCTTSSRRSR